MRLPTSMVTALVGVALVGCDKIPFLSKGDSAAGDTTITAQREAPPPAPTAVPAAPQPEPRPARVARPVVDEPWTPLDTGTITPGMTRSQVIALWGVPVTERQIGNYHFIYFRNGCEATCGTHDVVILEGGQVVDAIVRGEGHHYAGVSSSPPDRKPEFTPPGRPGGME